MLCCIFETHSFYFSGEFIDYTDNIISFINMFSTIISLVHHIYSVYTFCENNVHFLTFIFYMHGG